MEDLEKRTQDLVDEINRKVDSLIEDSNQYFEDERKRLVTEYENEAREETSVYLEQELNELKINVQLKESQAKWKARKDLFIKRQAMVDDLFEEISKKLKAYSSSTKYDAWLKDSLNSELKKASKENPIVIEFKPVDQPMIERLCKDYMDMVTLESRETIFIGGYIVTFPNLGIEEDNTIDVKLKDQKEWFAINSGLDF